MNSINNIHQDIEYFKESLREKKIYFDENISIFNDELQNLIEQELSIEDIIKDFSIDEEVRILALEKFSTSNSIDSTTELLNTIGSIYLFSGTSMLESFIYLIIVSSTINIIFKIYCINLLISYVKDSEIKETENIINEDKDENELSKSMDENLHISRIDEGEDEEILKINTEDDKLQKRKNKLCFCLNSVCQTFQDLSTSIKLETVIKLMQYDFYVQESNNYFCYIVNDKFIGIDFRYKSIIDLQNSDILNKEDHLLKIYTSFCQNEENHTYHRILSSQYILRNSTKDSPLFKIIENILLQFASDDYLDTNLRADACDTLLLYGNSESIKTASTIIDNLGNSLNRNNVIYQNSQNVHNDAIEDSVKEILEFLSTIKENNLSFEFVKSELLRKLKDRIMEHKNSCKILNSEIPDFCSIECEELNNFINKVKVSLNRILYDNNIYTFNLTLQKLLIKLYNYIQNHDYVLQLEQRLFEELVDMSGTCSSGFISRLCNVISGFSDFTIKIGYEHQIAANLSGRLNYYIKNLNILDDNNLILKRIEDVRKIYNNQSSDEISSESSDSDKSNHINPNFENSLSDLELMEIFQMKVIEELTFVVHIERTNFLLFFRTYIPVIREEMYKEFVPDYVDDTTFDLYMRKAIYIYEGMNY